MVMDLFFNTTLSEAAEGEKLRMHFHEFMMAVHKEMHALQQSQETEAVRTKSGLMVHRRKALKGHPVILAAQNIARTRCRQLLCLDEMQVTDVADAMILRRLFEGLVSEGVCIVFTSNVPPEGLYSDPYLSQSREFFLPFIELLYGHCTVQVVGEGRLDYRSLPPVGSSLAEEYGELVKATPRGGYFTDMDELDRAWSAVSAGVQEAATIEVEFGRELDIQKACPDGAWLDFDYLCSKNRALGAADFVALSSAYEHLFVAGIEPLAASQRDEARRLVILIDTIYEQRVRLTCGADCEPQQIFQNILKLEDCRLEEKLSYMRAVSRLQEMRRTGAVLEAASGVQPQR